MSTVRVRGIFRRSGCDGKMKKKQERILESEWLITASSRCVKRYLDVTCCIRLSETSAYKLLIY